MFQTPCGSRIYPRPRQKKSDVTVHICECSRNEQEVIHILCTRHQSQCWCPVCAIGLPLMNAILDRRLLAARAGNRLWLGILFRLLERAPARVIGTWKRRALFCCRRFKISTLYVGKKKRSQGLEPATLFSQIVWREEMGQSL